jgi:hypothetical protein
MNLFPIFTQSIIVIRDYYRHYSWGQEGRIDFNGLQEGDLK